MNTLSLGILLPFILLCHTIQLDRQRWTRGIALDSSKRDTNTTIDNNTHSTNISWAEFDINTNYYESIPNTNVVREYWFNIVNTTAAPDGIERPVILVNGQFPGPSIEANWGDIVRVYLTNQLQNNGSTIHFHGVRMLNTNQMDGVASLTQCPVAPGSSYTYEWKAEQYGTSWYHSHFSMQAWEGVFGPIIIHGPATGEYDEDLGAVFLNDWSHQTVDEMYQSQLEEYSMPQMQGGLLNGKNTWIQRNGQMVGERFQMTFVPGKRYLLRLINAAIHTHFKFSIDSHQLTVIANDFVPIVPFNTTNVPISMGQRYDVIVQANQTTENYWMRAIPQFFCSNNTASDNVRGIVRYQGATNNTDPTSTKWMYGEDRECEDIPAESLVPWLALDADLNNANTVNQPIDIAPFGDPNLYLWTIGGNTFNVSWNNPTLQQITSKSSNAINWTADQGVVEVTQPNQWTIFIIQTYIGASHPIHLHGHDFFILAQGLGTYNPQEVSLQTKNPPRRDTAMLPSQKKGGGYLVLAFQGDNPGVWLMHCHVGFHPTDGFAQQIVERKEELKPSLDTNVLNETCAAWDKYTKDNPHGVQYRGVFGSYDSGV